MSNLPVREMVLYKHGVGFYVREGEVDGTETVLTFRADEVNDILKSLAVFDRAGGQVYGVHYQTPMDRAHRLANTSIRLGSDASITQLFQQLRGREVMLVISDNKNKQFTYTGRIIGVEKQMANLVSESTQIFYVSMLTSDGASHIFPFESIRQFTIRDDQSKQDLTYFLDTSMSQDNRRTVTVRMSEGKHDLVVNYVAPSPTWRVSYRLVAETDEGENNTGKALLQGWGLFDNRLEEDLEDVKVTLVAGQPISFIYDLYESKIPERPVIKDEARTVEAPVEYRAEKRRKQPPAPPVAQRMAAMAPMAMMEESADVPDWLSDASHVTMDDMESSTVVSTETRESGETFQYQVTTPVTVKRGESALVPILSNRVNYERELLYNRDKLPDHPVASLRFENQTGLTLERGPVTLVEDGDYKGEAIIPFTRDKNPVYVPYAVELGITVKEELKTDVELHQLAIEGAFVKEQMYSVFTTTYTIDNSTDNDKTVTIESSLSDNQELFDTPPPDAETLNEKRWKVTCASGELTEFVQKHREMYWNRTRIRNLNYARLEQYLSNQYLDETLIAELQDILRTVQRVAEMRITIGELEQERQTLYAKQEQLRKNMGSLGSTGKEGTLRQRVVDQLEASQDRLEAIDTDIAGLKSAIEQTEAAIDEMIQALGDKYTSEDN